MEVLARGNYIIKRVDGKRNLLDWQATWKEGSLPAGWSINGVIAENSIVVNENPFAIKSVMWKCTPNASSTNNGEAAGGFITPYLKLDNTHTYRYTAFVYREKASKGSIYHGCYGVDNLSGTANTNPYFFANGLPAGQWYLLVGYIHPNKADVKWQMSTSGIYDMSGKKITTGTDYKLQEPNVDVRLRNYLFYTDNPEDVAYFYNPRLEVCDGNELSIEQLLQISTRDEIDAVKVEYKSEIQKLDNKIAFSVTEVKTYADDKATSEASKAVGNMQIGGRNLALKSGIPVVFPKNYNLYSSAVSLVDLIDRDFVISYDYEYSNVSTSTAYNTYRFGCEIPYKDASGIISYVGNWIYLPKSSTGLSGKGRTSKVVKIPAGHTISSTGFSMYLQILSGNLTITNFKVEVGNKATDWSPAPEDVEADAQAKADAARVAAEAVAVAKAELAKTTAQAYADGKVTAEEQRAIADAQAKLNEAKVDAQAKANAAQSAATAAAAADATNKANKAQNNAISDAATKYTTKTEHSSAITLLSNQIEQRVTKTVFDNAISDAQLLAKAMSRGVMLYDDPTFKNGLNTIRPYNNNGNGSVVITREQIEGIPNDSNYCLKIETLDSNANPPLGGFYFATPTKANKEMVCRFVAKIPENYTLGFGSNAYGAGATSKWLTPNSGTGKWEEYAYYLKCGETGTFSSTFFFYLNKLTDQTYPVTWYLAYSTVFDLNANEVFTPRAEYEAKITVLESSITSKVSQSNFDALGNRVTAAESSIVQMPNKISLAVSTSEEKIKTSLTLDSTGISLLGKKIALTGVVTFSAFAADAQSKVNNAQSTANSAVSKADAAQSTANSAVSKADTAQSGLTSLISSMGAMAYQDMVSLAKLDTTIIEGGHIKTNLIDANAIITNALLAQKIAATDITTSRLTVTTGAKIGGWSVEGNSLVTRSENSAKLLVEVSGTKFLKVNDLNTMLEIRTDGDGKKGINISTYGNSNALYIIANGDGHAIKSAGSHRFYQRSGEIWNAPGVLWAGRISANGGVESRWGDGCTVSQASATAVGWYDIYHDLGNREYYVMVTPTPYTTEGDRVMTAMVASKYSNYFSVVLADDTGRNKRCAFELAIIGRNRYLDDV